MRAQRIPIGEWKACLDELTQHHRNHPVTVLVLTPDGIPRTEAHGQALQGISLDPKGSTPGSVYILVEGDAGQIERHLNAPVRMERVRTDDGLDRALSIEDDDGDTTVVRFELSPLDS